MIQKVALDIWSRENGVGLRAKEWYATLISNSCEPKDGNGVDDIFSTMMAARAASSRGDHPLDFVLFWKG